MESKNFWIFEIIKRFFFLVVLVIKILTVIAACHRTTSQWYSRLCTRAGSAHSDWRKRWRHHAGR